MDWDSNLKLYFNIVIQPVFIITGDLEEIEKVNWYMI